jgi:hypothetical protein
MKSRMRRVRNRKRVPGIIMELIIQKGTKNTDTREENMATLVLKASSPTRYIRIQEKAPMREKMILKCRGSRPRSVCATAIKQGRRGGLSNRA